MQAIESGSSMKRPYIVDTFYAPAEAPKNDWFITWFWIGFMCVRDSRAGLCGCGVSSGA
jgi:hypothetical protein